MADKTGIAWCDHTHNPWTGCTRVSPGCDHCYAEAISKRNTITFGSWEPGAPRKRTGPANWRRPLAWDRAAELAGVRRRVFCASMADVFDNQAPAAWRADLWALVRDCPNLDWQFLTKRPQLIARGLPPDWGDGYANVWLGTTTENQAEAERRIPHLRAIPAIVRFLSAEPLLELVRPELAGIGWVIVGGESGPGSRPMARAWAESLIAQCDSEHVPVFMKQVGTRRGPDWPAGITGKGDEPVQWPVSLQVQRFPSEGN